MVITTQSSIKVYSDVKLRPTETVKFEDYTQRDTYFNRKTVIFDGNAHYIPPEEGAVDIRLDYKDALRASYMVFETGGKTFYAFVASVEHVSSAEVNNTVISISRIHFDIDLLQTFLFDDYGSFNLGLAPSYIQRAHVDNDPFGGNTVPEMAISDRVKIGSKTLRIADSDGIEYKESVIRAEDYSVAFLVSRHFDIDQDTGLFIDGGEAMTACVDGTPLPCEVYGGFKPQLTGSPPSTAFPVGYGYTLYENFLKAAASYIVSAFVYPDFAFSYRISPQSPSFNLRGNETFIRDGKYGSRLTLTGVDLDVYSPPFGVSYNAPDYYRANEHILLKNAKLASYPYREIRLISSSGDSVSLAPNGFDGSPQFVCNTVFAPFPEFRIFAKNYFDAYEYGGDGMEGVGVSCNAFPIIPFSVDALKDYLLRNSASRETSIQNAVYSSTTKTVVSAGSSALTGYVLAGASGGSMGGPTGALIGAGAGLLTGLISSAIDYENAKSAEKARETDLKNTPDNISNLALSPSLNFANCDNGITCEIWAVPLEQAKRLDEYFTRYGYAQESVFVPNLEARENYTYVKCNGARLSTGSLNAEVKTAIEQIFDAGVTLWRGSSADLFGDYTVDNRPISEV